MICGNKIGGPQECSTYLIETQDGSVSVYGVVVDELKIFNACCADVANGKAFIGDTGIGIGTNDCPICRMTNGIHKVYPGVEFLLKLPVHSQWDYTNLQGMIAHESTPHKIEMSIMDDAVYNSNGTKISDVTKDANSQTIRFNITNDTNESYLLYYFVCKEE